MTNYLPDNEMEESTESDWLNITENGTYRMRIMGIKGDDNQFMEGWEVWEEYEDENGSKRSRPHRSKFVQGAKAPQELLDLERNGDARYFRMFVVFYEGRPKIYEVRQKTIRRQILELTRDEEWGDPRDYDIAVTRSGQGKETSYNVMPKPKEPLTPEMLQRVEDARIDLQAIWEGGQPFGALESDSDARMEETGNDQENIERISNNPNAALTRMANKALNK